MSPATLWSRLKGWFARPAGERPVAPGHFESGSKASFVGWVAVAPWVWPKRSYVVYVPQGRKRWRRAPLIVLIHGCRQSAEDIAQGTRIRALADSLAAFVLLPQQHPRANPWGCWNWFDRGTGAGKGEAAIIAAQIRSVRRRFRIHRRQIILAGMSSGAALAATVALHRPELVSGVFMHSGLAAGAASSPSAALEVMERGPDTDAEALGTRLRAVAPADDPCVPVMVMHGAADPVVAVRNARAVIAQFLAFNGAAAGTLPARAYTSAAAPDRRMHVEEWQREGRLIARLLVVDRLAHAWSGGDSALPYNDPAPPLATTLLASFMTEVFADRRRRSWLRRLTRRVQAGAT